MNPGFDAYSFAGHDALKGWTIYTSPMIVSSIKSK